ncbi:MAG: hypothetical protein WC807_20780 [Hyphomicrobium sp.]|jgi:hypothetical protein
MKNFCCATGVMAIFLALAVPPAQSQETPSALNCEFKEGTATSYEGGVFKSKAPQPLSFAIEGIDLEGQKAVLKTGEGAGGKLSIVRAINANHFIEAVNEGFLNLTTVYDKDPATGRYPAVHSRHFGILGQPVTGQYTGTCQAR